MRYFSCSVLLAGVMFVFGNVAFAQNATTPLPTIVGSVASANQGEPVGGPGTGKAWKSYSNATGLGMKYPADWTLQPLDGPLSLIPPDQARNDKGPQEVYLVTGEGAQGVTDIYDPRVVPFLEAQMQIMAPFLQRTGAPKRVRVATAPGVIVTWEGSNPDGRRIRANLHATILKGFAVSLLAMGEPDKIAKRESVVQGIFSSFVAGAGKQDAALAGQWKFWSYKASADGKHGTETMRFLNLRPDGTCTWSAKAESSGNYQGRNSLGQQTWNDQRATQNQDSDQGTWSAADGELFVLWEDGTIGNWDYKVSGEAGQRKLLLKGSKPELDEWVEVR